MTTYLSASDVGTSWTSLTDVNGDAWQTPEDNVYRGTMVLFTENADGGSVTIDVRLQERGQAGGNSSSPRTIDDDPITGVGAGEVAKHVVQIEGAQWRMQAKAQSGTADKVETYDKQISGSQA